MRSNRRRDLVRLGLGFVLVWSAAASGQTAAPAPVAGQGSKPAAGPAPSATKQKEETTALPVASATKAGSPVATGTASRATGATSGAAKKSPPAPLSAEQRAAEIRTLESRLKPKTSAVWTRIEALEETRRKVGEFTATEARALAEAADPAGRTPAEQHLLRLCGGATLARAIEAKLTPMQRTVQRNMDVSLPSKLPPRLTKAPDVPPLPGGKPTTAYFDVAAVKAGRKRPDAPSTVEIGRKFDLAIAHLNGAGVPKNSAEAKRYLEQVLQMLKSTKAPRSSTASTVSQSTGGVRHETAAGHGSIMGAVWFGLSLEESGDRGSAMGWFRRSAKWGGYQARVILGMKLLFNGELGAGSFQEVFDGLLESARQGDPDAFYVIGVAVHNGYGVPQDRMLGRKWLDTGVKAGSKAAISTVEKMDQQAKQMAEMMAELNRSNRTILEGQRKFAEAMKGFNDGIEASGASGAKKSEAKAPSQSATKAGPASGAKSATTGAATDATRAGEKVQTVRPDTRP